MLSHKPYTLTKPNLSRLHADGRRDAWMFAEPGSFVLSGGVWISY